MKDTVRFLTDCPMAPSAALAYAKARLPKLDARILNQLIPAEHTVVWERAKALYLSCKLRADALTLWEICWQELGPDGKTVIKSILGSSLALAWERLRR